MAEAFYYNIYPSTPVIGGGPGPWIYSPRQQDMDAALASLKVKATNEGIANQYKQQGIYYPVEVPTEPLTPLERSGGVLLSNTI